MLDFRRIPEGHFGESWWLATDPLMLVDRVKVAVYPFPTSSAKKYAASTSPSAGLTLTLGMAMANKNIVDEDHLKDL